jgi:hypothetical protein
MWHTAPRLALVAAALMGLVAVQPAAAQPAGPQPQLVDGPGLGPVYTLPVAATRPNQLPRLVNLPGYGDVYLVPVQPVDTRSARQACIDEQTAKVGGSPSRLELRVIDLKCSQR